MTHIQKNRTLGLLTAIASFVASQVAPLVGDIDLLTAYPSFPKWAIDAIRWVSNAGLAISIIGSILTGGLAAIAYYYIRKYGVRLGISL